MAKERELSLRLQDFLLKNPALRIDLNKQDKEEIVRILGEQEFVVVTISEASRE